MIDKILENYSIFSCSTLILAAVCFSSSDMVYWHVFILIASIINVSMLYTKYYVKASTMSYFTIWFLSFNLLLTIYGVYTPYAGGYSILYHWLIILSLLVFYNILEVYENKIDLFISKLLIVTTLSLSSYIMYSEYTVFIEKIALILVKGSWYRLGDATGWNPNSIAMIFGLLYVLSYFAVNNRINVKSILFCMLIQAIIILLTGSKKGLIFLLLPMILDTILQRMTTKAIKKFLISLLIIGGILFTVFQVDFFYNLLGYRVNDMLYTLGIVSTGELSMSTDQRDNMVRDAIFMWFDAPIFGWGWNAFFALGGYGLYSHNNYAEILSSMGIIGFFSYYCMHFYMLFTSIIKKNKKCFIIMICILFSDIGAVTVYGGIVTYVFLFMCYIWLFPRKGDLMVYDKTSMYHK